MDASSDMERSQNVSDENRERFFRWLDIQFGTSPAYRKRMCKALESELDEKLPGHDVGNLFRFVNPEEFSSKTAEIKKLSDWTFVNQRIASGTAGAALTRYASYLRALENGTIGDLRMDAFGGTPAAPRANHERPRRMSKKDERPRQKGASSPKPGKMTACGLPKEPLRQVLPFLSVRERDILTLRFGLNDGFGLSLEEVGKRFASTRERIRKREADALRNSCVKEKVSKKQQENHMDKTTAKASGTPGTKEKSDFDRLLDEFAEFAMESAKRRLGKDAAGDYKSRLKRVAREIDAEYGAGWFEKFALSYPGAGDAKDYGRCVTFIAGRVQAAGHDKASWRDRRSAFRKFVDFLEGRYQNAVTAAPEERQAMPVTEIPAEVPSVPKSVAEVPPAESDAVVETLGKRDLMNKFLARLKTQSRWYPSIGEGGVLFPARLINRIFSANGDKRWTELMRADLGRMGIRIGTGDGDICRLGDIADMELLADGRFTVKVAGCAHAVHTRTCRQGVVVERSRKGWAGLSIDHLVPMENDMRANVEALSAFRELTHLVSSFLEKRGEKYNLRYDEGWFRQVYEAKGQKLDGMRDALYGELCLLDRRYELMDTLENGKRSNRI